MNKKVIHTVFEDAATRFPQNIAIETENENISYQQLNNYANRISHLLKFIACKKEAIITVLVPSSILMIGSLLSVFKSGNIFLPVDFSFSEKRLRQIFTETFDGIVITTDKSYGAVIDLIDQLKIDIKQLIVLDERYAVRLYIL